jgi:hypothetical protein
MALATSAAIVAGVGGLATAAVSYNAAKDAAGQQRTAANTTAAEQQQAFTTVQGLYKPEQTTGVGANTLLDKLFGINPSTGKATGASGDYSAFYNSPGYNFSLTQGENAINRNAAATGGLYSTNTLTNENNYAQGVASTQYQSYLSNLLGLANLGNVANAGISSAATGTANNRGTAAMNAANATATGDVNEAGAIGSGIGSISKMLGAYSTPAPATNNASGVYTGTNIPLAPSLSPNVAAAASGNAPLQLGQTTSGLTLNPGP